MGHTLRVKTKDGSKDFYIEVNCRFFKNKQRRIVRRAGSVRDISSEIALKEKVQRFTNEFSSLLHVYSAVLDTTLNSIDTAIDYIIPLQLKEFQQFEEYKKKEIARVSIEELVLSLEEILKSSGIFNYIDLFKHYNLLKNFLNDKIHVLYRLSTILEIVNHILNTIEKMQAESKLTQELLFIQEKCKRLVPIIITYRLQEARREIFEMENMVLVLREFVITEDKSYMPTRKICFIDYLIDKAITHNEDYAKNRNVKIVKNIKDFSYKVNVIENLVIRALSNLIQNAIKYSWTRKIGLQRWVEITIGLDGKYICINIENWGVPIAKEEIDKGLLFTLGFRGRFATDRDRIGTGVGLYDAKQIAQKHGGEISITSAPAYPKKDFDYSQPFITTVSLKLLRN